MTRLAFIGGGNMARSLIGGLLKTGVAPATLSVAEPLAESRQTLGRDFGVACYAENRLAVAEAEVIVLAVKPQVMPAIHADLRDILQRNRPLLISIAAGVRLDQLERWFGNDLADRALHAEHAGADRRRRHRPVRQQPGQPGAEGAGAAHPRRRRHHPLDRRRSPDGHRHRAVRFRSGVFLRPGRGAGSRRGGARPARDTARALAAQTCLGAGRMLAEGGEDPAVLRQRVTSPHGTTQAALESFTADGLPQHRRPRRRRRHPAWRGTRRRTGQTAVSYLLNALALLLDLAFDAVVVLLLLRVAAEACRADFHNPLSQFVYRYTNPVLAPIRRVLPNWRRINLAALLLAWLAMLVKRLLLFALLGVMPHPLGLIVLSLAELLDFVLLFYLVLIFGWSLLSMFSVDRRQPLLRLAGSIVAPLLRPLRGKLVAGQIDFAPMVVMLALLLARLLIAAPLLDLGARLAMGA